MQYTKFLIAVLISGIIKTVLGFFTWIFLLKKFLPTHLTHTAGIFRSRNDMIWWSLLLGYFAFACLLTYVISLNKRGTIIQAVFTAAILGFLASLAADCTVYAQLNIFGRTVIGIDIIMATFTAAIMGAVIGLFLKERTNK